MSARNKKVSFKPLLSATGLQHFKSSEPITENNQIYDKKKQWNYNDFVSHLLEVIAILHTKERIEKHLDGC
jgi:predicted SprT family Zn-dependent metalloprotease